MYGKPTTFSDGIIYSVFGCATMLLSHTTADKGPGAPCKQRFKNKIQALVGGL